MLLLISDANILMDVEVGDLVAPMFSLGYQFAVPDFLQLLKQTFVEEQIPAVTLDHSSTSPSMSASRSTSSVAEACMACTSPSGRLHKC